MAEKTQKSGRTIKWPIYPLYGIDGIGFGATSALGSYLKFVCTDVMLMSLADVTKFDLLSPLINAVLAVFYGVIASKVRNGKNGGRFFKILVGTGIIYGALIFIRHWDGLVPILGKSYWLVGALLMCASVLNIGVSSVAINAMNATISRTPDDTVTLAKTRGIYIAVSTLIFSALIPVLMDKWADKGNGYTFAVIGLLCGALYLIFNIAQAFLIRKVELDSIGAVEEAPAKSEAPAKVKMSTKDMFKGLIKSPQTLVVMAWIFADWLTYLYLVTIASYYFIYVAENTLMLSTFFTVGNFAAMGGTFFSNYITKALGLRKTAIICSGICTACGFIAFALCRVNPIFVMIFCALLTMCHGIMGPTATGLMADCCVVAENKLHADQTTFIMGFLGSPASWAPYVYNLVANGILSWAGYTANAVPTDELKTKLSFLLLPVGIFAAIGLLLMAFLYKGTRERIDAMREENRLYREAHADQFA